MATINKDREMRVAVKRVEGFAKEFGEAHRNLARHAAFPLVLTPDLLYQIWANFVPEASWSAVAMVLLSRLCREVGYEMYQMDICDRNLLLQELKAQFGQERFDELGEFLLDYVAQHLIGDDPDTEDLREAQEWVALAYTKPNKAARELALALSERVKDEDMGEVLWLASLVETLAEPLVEAGFEPLLIYSQGMACLARNYMEAAEIQLTQIPIGTVGVIISYVGKTPENSSDHLVEPGYKGIWKIPLKPGKYPINTKVMDIVIVPTHDIILEWSNRKKPPSNYDANLNALELLSKDGFIFYIEVTQIISIPEENALKMISRFVWEEAGVLKLAFDSSSSNHRYSCIKNLITKILDPIVNNYFRNFAQDYNALDIPEKWRELQRDARDYITSELDAYGVGLVHLLINNIYYQ